VDLPVPPELSSQKGCHNRVASSTRVEHAREGLQALRSPRAAQQILIELPHVPGVLAAQQAAIVAQSSNCRKSCCPNPAS